LPANFLNCGIVFYGSGLLRARYGESVFEPNVGVIEAGDDDAFLFLMGRTGRSFFD